MTEITPEFDIDTATSQDKPGMRSLTTTSQLQRQIDLCGSGEITPQTFYLNVAFDLGLVTDEDWNYLQQNDCIPSPQMLEKLLTVIYRWKVVDCGGLYTPFSNSTTPQ
jgi:hypothetical protein